MQLAMVGLGRMGANMVRRLIAGGHDCVAYDVSPEAVTSLESEGATGASSLDDLVSKLTTPRAVWIMVPAAITGKMVDEIAAKLDPGDIIIDGGNSYYRETSTGQRRSGRRAFTTSTSARAVACSGWNGATAS